MVKKVAPTDANVLILGENGTGKELIAREIHRQSKRSDDVFISVDLGSLSESLFESELFGHVKGAFTGASEDRKGRFETADGGTLFLDEIGNLPISMQSKLLTVLQNRYIIPVGSNKPVPVDVRLITATNKHLPGLIKITSSGKILCSGLILFRLRFRHCATAETISFCSPNIFLIYTGKNMKNP